MASLGGLCTGYWVHAQKCDNDCMHRCEHKANRTLQANNYCVITRLSLVHAHVHNFVGCDCV